jgi:tetratricopeptide (TPR) repeat protein
MRRLRSLARVVGAIIILISVVLGSLSLSGGISLRAGLCGLLGICGIALLIWPGRAGKYAIEAGKFAGLVLLGVVLALTLLEIILRLGGFFVSLPQTLGNIAPADQESYRIICLGESTTAGGTDSSWPAQMEVILNNRSRTIRFKVYNLGIPGITTAYILSNLGDDLERYKPDMVISMMWINDRIRPPVRYVGRFGAGNGFLMGELRLIHLTRWLFEASENRRKGVLQEKLDNLAGSANKNLSDHYYRKGVALFENGSWDENGVNESKVALQKALEIDPSNEKAVVSLGLILRQKALIGNATAPGALVREAVDALERYDKAYPYSTGVKELLANFYTALNLTDKAKAISLDVLEMAPRNSHEYSLALLRLAQIYHFENESAKEREMYDWLAWIRFFLGNNLPVVSLGDELGKLKPVMDLLYKGKGLSAASMAERDSGELTAYHYRLLADILQERGIRYVAMQYPTLNVGMLRGWLGNRSDVTFVSNRENFEAALDNKTFWGLFVDNFGGSFGHATLDGNRLIAESAAEAILNELNVTVG